MAITAECLPLPSPSTIEAEWKALEKRAAPNFFRSWCWIGTWIETAVLPHVGQEAARLLRVHDDATLIGLGIVCASRVRRLLGRSTAAFFLSETGADRLDAPTVEYNGFLAVSGREGEVFAAAVNELVSRRDLDVGPWAWSVGMFNAVTEIESVAVDKARIPYRVRKTENCPVISLTAAGLDAYYASISRNTRQQLRRAISLAKANNELTLMRAPPNEADSYFRELKTLHQDAWQIRRGHAGAFADAHFETFARALIKRGVSDGNVELIRISSAGGTIGVLMNFRSGTDVFAYQSGFRYSGDNRFKPGLICHVLAAEDAANRGASAYHFMAGQNRYKRSLGNASERMYWLEIGRGDLLWWAESSLHRFRDLLRPPSPSVEA